MSKSLAVITISVLITFSVLITMWQSTGVAGDDYCRQRKNILQEEKSMSLGGSSDLSENERRVDEILLEEKIRELKSSYENSSSFLPSMHFFRAKRLIDESAVFSLIRKIPKGASLHTHLLAAVSVDFLVNEISHRDHLYGGFINGAFKLRFLSAPDQDDRCEWKSVAQWRKERPDFDAWLRRQLSLQVENPEETYPSVDAVWKRFKGLFTAVYEMLCFKPVFREYIQQALKELYSDNVMYTELRGTFMPLYELDGTTYSARKFFEVFVEAVEDFKKTHPGFLGVRYIHSIYKGVDRETLRNGLDQLIELRELFPDFIAGFDFVGYEEEGHQLLDFRHELVPAREHLQFFFHAGETNWFGHTDENLVDAILLNASRIGHGFALVKHPVLLNLARERDIAVEVCPISNQVLMLNDDPRNHPAAELIATGYPVVVGNDDPASWGASGLSYDWYVAFMAMTRKDDGIAVLKQLAINSLRFSAMADAEKATAIERWTRQWGEFLDEILAAHKT